MYNNNTGGLSLNFFCKTCEHNKVPVSIRKKFNKYVKKLFYECPIEDETIDGCTVKYLMVGWTSFFNFLQKKDLLTDDEKSELEKIGWKGTA